MADLAGVLNNECDSGIELVGGTTYIRALGLLFIRVLKVGKCGITK